MALIKGFIDVAGRPCLSLLLHSPAGETRRLVAVIDTGFTGFLLAPDAAIVRMGFQVYADIPYRFATGGRVRLGVTVGSIQLDSGEIHSGRIVCGGGEDTLLGMDFLRSAQKALYVDSKYAALLDEDELRRSLL